MSIFKRKRSISEDCHEQSTGSIDAPNSIRRLFERIDELEEKIDLLAKANGKNFYRNYNKFELKEGKDKIKR